MRQLFEELGQRAIYTPSGGQAVPTRVVSQRAEAPQPGPAGATTHLLARFDIPADAVARFAKGDRLATGGVEYVVEHTTQADEYSRRLVVRRAR